jgi:hypothetical protein
VKKIPNIGGSLTYIVLLLTLSTSPQLVAIPTWAQAAPTTPNTPTDTPIPVRNDVPNNNALWWLLLIPVGGVLWAMSRSSRRQSTVAQPTNNNSPVNSIDPVFLDGRAPQSQPLDAATVMGKSRQVVSDGSIAPIEPQLLKDGATQTLSSNGRDRVPEVPFAPIESLPVADSTPGLASVTERTVVSHSHQQPLESTLDQRRSNDLADRLPAAQIQLLEERLVVDTHKRKVGEVIVRKEIETRLVQVPIRREILIVEQVNPEFKQLAVVDLGQLPDDDPTAIANGIELAPTVAASFTSPHAAIEFLKSISDRSSDSSTELQMNIVLKDADAQAFYQEWLEHHSATTDAIGVSSGRVENDIRSLD